MPVRCVSAGPLRAALTGVGLLLAACSLVPDYRRPDASVPASWDGPAVAQAGVAAQGAWWRSFASPELDGLMREGLGRNLNLAAAVARIEQARGTAQADEAPLFPQLALGGTQGMQRGVRSTSTQQLVLQASYELDLFGRLRATADSGRALADASAFDADTVAMTLAANVASIYFQCLSLAERIRLAENIAKDSRRVLSLIEVRRAAGVATDLQFEQQRALLAGFEGAVPTLQHQRDVAQHALAVLVGRAPEGFRIGADSLSGIAHPAVAADLPATLLERRPDIRAAEARLVSANFDVGAARAAFYPTISLSALVGAGARHLSSPLPPLALTGLGASLLQPVFEGGLLQGQLRARKGRKVEYVATYRQAVLTALQEVENALSGVDRIRAAEAIARQAEQAASKAAELAKLQYRLGSADYLTVLTTEQTLYQAQDAALQLRLQHLQQIVSLFRALGGGFDAPGGPQMVTALGDGRR